MGRKSIAVRCPGVKHNCINRLVSNWPLVVFIMVPPWDAKPVAADPPWLGLGLRLGLELEPELRPEFLPPPSRTFGQISNDPDKPWRQAPPSKE
jgi:hypothetical protein